MKTKIVYTFIDSPIHFFFEELWASLFSLRLYNKDANVTVLTDKTSADHIQAVPELSSMINSLKIVDVDSKYNAVERSRIIKTNVRNLIDGDYLYIDTDTVICGSLDIVDNIQEEFACVLEGHVPLKNHPAKSLVIKDMKRLYNMDVSKIAYWFNMGVTFVKDTPRTRDFFKKWNENWITLYAQTGNKSDQRPLLKTDIDSGNLIRPMDGRLNCQVPFSPYYLYDALILHFIHMPQQRFHLRSPFLNGEFYKRLHEKGHMTTGIEDEIRNVKLSFQGQLQLVSKEQASFVETPFCLVLFKIQKHFPIIWKSLNKLSQWML